ncbi:MAG: hypothetical protein J0L54_16795 [Chitinophagales bacterium]|nr:hypothetical protein [Chitinophagales bacterium]
MRPLFFIAAFVTASCYGQTYQRFSEFTTKQLLTHQIELSQYYNNFQKLILKRDTAYLKEKLTKIKADKVYIIEGYNFETNKYSIFEEYKLDNSSFLLLGNSIFFLDKLPQVFSGSLFLYDSTVLSKSISIIDTIFPRKYRYGAGCVISDTTFKIFADLETKAKQDGIVIEKYCRVETLIDNRTNMISVKYLFPIKGQREFESQGVGMLTDYPPGLDFWLFASPYYVDK